MVVTNFMKSINMKKILLIMLSATIMLSACKKEYEEIGAPSSKFEGATADWGLTSFKVVIKLLSLKNRWI